MKKLLRSWPAKDQGGAGALSGEADAPAGLQAQFPNVLSPRGTGSSLTRWSDLDSKPAGMHDAEAQHDADATPQARTDSKRLTPPAQHNAAHHRKRLERYSGTPWFHEWNKASDFPTNVDAVLPVMTGVRCLCSQDIQLAEALFVWRGLLLQPQPTRLLSDELPELYHTDYYHGKACLCMAPVV